MEDIVGDS